MKNLILGLTAIVASVFAINAHAESSMNNSFEDFKETINKLDWDCKITDGSYYYQGIDHDTEEKRVVYKIVYDGETICESNDPMSFCNSFVAAKTPWAYKRGVLTDNANGNNYYRICRTDRSLIPGAMDNKFEIGVDKND